MKTLEEGMDKVQHEVVNGFGEVCGGLYHATAAVKYAVAMSDDDYGSIHYVHAVLGHTRLDPRGGDEGETHVLRQEAAAVPVATMRRALALVEAHDAELAAELRASLVQP